MKRIISMILMVSILFTSVTAFAGTGTNYSKNFEDENQLEEISLDLLKNMNDKEREIFLSVVMSDNKLKSYHYKINNVSKMEVLKIETLSLLGVSIDDSNQIGYNAINSYSSRSRGLDPLEILKAELLALGLSTPLVYALLANGAGVVAAGVDGSLPTGDALEAIILVVSLPVLIAYSSEFVDNFSGIKAAFKKAFSSISNDISASLDMLFMKVQGLPTNKEFQDFNYHYNKHAQEFVGMPGGPNKKPDKEEFWALAKKFLKKTGSAIVRQHKHYSNRLVKFDFTTLEFMVIEKGTNKIITYFRPYWSTGRFKSFGEWRQLVINYVQRNIR